MTEHEWQNCMDPAPMLEFLGGRLSDRKWRLFNAACCRALWDLLDYGGSQRAVEMAELWADDLVGPEAIRKAAEEANVAVSEVQNDIELYGPMAPLYASEAAHFLLIDEHEWRNWEPPYKLAGRAHAAAWSDPVELEAGYGWPNRPDADQIRQASNEANARGQVGSRSRPHIGKYTYLWFEPVLSLARSVAQPRQMPLRGGSFS